MGKKKTKPAKAALPASLEKVPVQLRLHKAKVERLQEIAKQTGVSVNELMSVVVAWMSLAARPGKMPVEDEKGAVTEVDRPGSIWFGVPGGQVILVNKITGHESRGTSPGMIQLTLDFSPESTVWEW